MSKTPLNSQKVAAVRVEDHNEIARGLRAALSLLPDLLPSTLPRRILIKPNLCDIAAWETGVTTDPRWLSVLASELRAVRRDVEILVVESDAVSAYKTHRSCDETFARLGFVDAAKEAGVELVNLSRADSIEIRLDDLPSPVRIPQLLLEELFFISIANLKVHGYTRMTGVLKNSIGLLTDAEISSLHPYLSILISRLHFLCPADLCIVDGRIGLEGQGPIIGQPVRMDTLLVGSNPLAVDQAAARLMGIAPKEVPHLRQLARESGARLGEVEILGEFRPRSFAFDGAKTLPSILAKFANRRFYNRIEEFSRLWIDRVYRLKQNPSGFAGSAIRKFTKSTRERQA